ncbi:hypothetical protein [Flavobacterium akiainvivens]|uniref:hypothetical protein n=1 Tax=Flavobacterium akiainvivens TaxID=1202724 RepID=UPI0006C8C50B|nr:hypothetical protein [Flavobacterium akiainvivens]SFQ70964.1 hypothetical protein SAMN05444144_11663 [Flavobacterium akiainvivens]
MKKTALLLFCSVFMAMCTTTKKTTNTTAAAKPKVTKSADFKAAPDTEKTAMLKELKAADAAYSVVVLTKNFKGENIKVSNGNKDFYFGYPITNLGNGLAEKFRIENGADIKIYDSRTKKETVLKSSDIKKNKFIYIAKDLTAKNPFVITYSDKLMAFK